MEIRRSKFHFVDLAGSERAKRTGASGQRFKEVTLLGEERYVCKGSVICGVVVN